MTEKPNVMPLTSMRTKPASYGEKIYQGGRLIAEESSLAGPPMLTLIYHGRDIVGVFVPGRPVAELRYVHEIKGVSSEPVTSLSQAVERMRTVIEENRR